MLQKVRFNLKVADFLMPGLWTLKASSPYIAIMEKIMLMIAFCVSWRFTNIISIYEDKKKENLE